MLKRSPSILFVLALFLYLKSSLVTAQPPGYICAESGNLRLFILLSPVGILDAANLCYQNGLALANLTSIDMNNVLRYMDTGCGADINSQLIWISAMDGFAGQESLALVGLLGVG
jgi:hypothetical protein